MTLIYFFWLWVIQQADLFQNVDSLELLILGLILTLITVDIVYIVRWIYRRRNQ